ncbi:MAG: STAS domain-containing protein [Actinomycetota bacterium]
MSAPVGRRAVDVASPQRGGIRIVLDERPGAVVVATTGNLDVYTVPTFWEAVRPLLDGSGPLVVDLTGIALIDSSGLAALVGLRNHLVQDGRRLGIACGRSARILRVTGLWASFVCAADLGGVLDRLGVPRREPSVT